MQIGGLEDIIRKAKTEPSRLRALAAQLRREAGPSSTLHKEQRAAKMLEAQQFEAEANHLEAGDHIMQLQAQLAQAKANLAAIRQESVNQSTAAQNLRLLISYFPDTVLERCADLIPLAQAKLAQSNAIQGRAWSSRL